MTCLGQAGTAAVLAAMVIDLNAHANHAQKEGPPPDNVRLTLSSQSAGNCPGGWCRFSVVVFD